MTRARRVAPPADDDFRADYADCFRLPVTGTGRSAADWARASLAGAEVFGGLFATLVWHGVLGFDLASRRAPATLAGWRIVHDEPSQLLVETDGARMAGRMRFAVDDDAVRWTTMLRFHGAGGRRTWRVAGRAHRVLAPRCLAHAAKEVSGPRDGRPAP